MRQTEICAQCGGQILGIRWGITKFLIGVRNNRVKKGVLIDGKWYHWRKQCKEVALTKALEATHGR